MPKIIFEDFEERFPDATRPDWYDKATRYLRADGDEGLFGRYLYELIRSMPQVETVLNIGTARGHSAVCAAKALTEANRDGVVHTIDLIPPEQPRDWHVEKQPDSDPVKGTKRTMRSLVEECLGASEAAVPIHFHTGDSSSLLANWDEPQPDLVFHDALHQYPTVRADIIYTTEMGPKTPIHVFDDCYLFSSRWTVRPFTSSLTHRLNEVPKLGGAMRLVRQYALSKTPFPGVTQAVDEAFEEGEWKTLEVVKDDDHAPITAMFPDRRYVPEQ